MRKAFHFHRLWPVILLGLSGLFGIGCGETTRVDVEEEIQKQVQLRLQEYYRVANARCQDDLMKEAGDIADSIVLDIARRMKDTLQRPERPIRPERPEQLDLQDSLPLSPFFNKTSSPGDDH
ncbi:MAG: hypothetical protein R2795_02285 [Saprospiraceae bacterium]